MDNSPSWTLGVVYTSTCGMECRRVWIETEVVLSLQLPLILIGDFNCLPHSSKKKGGKAFQVNRDIRELRTFIQRMGLIDLRFQRPKFTWCNNRMDLARVWEKLNRAFVFD